MAKMFNLLENELDMVHSSLSKTSAFVMNVQTFAGYILEDDDRDKYTKEMIEIVEEILKRTNIVLENIEAEQKYIENINNKIIELS